MIKSHREFLEFFEGISCIRMFIVSMMPEGEGIDGETGSIVTLTDKQQQAQQQPQQQPISPPATSSDPVRIQQELQPSNNTNTSHASIIHALSETPEKPVIDGVYEDRSNTNNSNNNNSNTIGTGYISSGDSDKELLFNPDNEEDEVNLSHPQINTIAPASSDPLISHTSLKTAINTATNNNTNTTTEVPPATTTERATCHRANNNTVSTELWSELKESYNDCVSNLQRFRSSHINIVAEVGAFTLYRV